MNDRGNGICNEVRKAVIKRCMSWNEISNVDRIRKRKAMKEGEDAEIKK